MFFMASFATGSPTEDVSPGNIFCTLDTPAMYSNSYCMFITILVAENFRRLVKRATKEIFLSQNSVSI